MFKKKNGSVHSSGVAIKGFYRVQIIDDKKGVVGDSGWKQNQVTNLGIRSYLVDWLTSSTGFAVTHMALGTGGAPASNATTLSGEVQVRQAVTSSIVASATAQFTGAFASANSFVTATSNISNIGLFCTSTKQSASLFAGNTYASSSCATNQSVRLYWRTLSVMTMTKFFKLREHLIEAIRSEILNWRRSETIIGTPALCGMMG